MTSGTARSALKPALTGVAAVVVGYVALALASTLVQQVWLGGVSYQHSSLSTLVLAGIFTPVAGVVAGIVVGSIGRCRPLAHGLALSVVIGAETTYLFVTHRVDGPLWFEAGAGATLAAGVMLGCWLVGLWLSKRAAARQP